MADRKFVEQHVRMCEPHAFVCQSSAAHSAHETRGLCELRDVGGIDTSCTIPEF
jgi:hypothetical protein